MLDFLGSKWGGYTIDVSLIHEDSIIISVGLGNDVSFEQVILQTWPDVCVVSVDPTQASANAVKVFQEQPRHLFVKKALWESSGETIYLGGPARSPLVTDGESAETISLVDLLEEVSNQFANREISLLKMNIEGAEYPTLKGYTDILDIPQLTIEWHHWLNKEGDHYKSNAYQNPYTLEDTKKAIKKIIEQGYTWVHRLEGDDRRVIQGTLFIKKTHSTEDYPCISNTIEL